MIYNSKYNVYKIYVYNTNERHTKAPTFVDKQSKNYKIISRNNSIKHEAEKSLHSSLLWPTESLNNLKEIKYNSI